MIENGLDVYASKDGFKADGVSYPAGSWVIPMDQPFSAMAKEVLSGRSIRCDRAGTESDWPPALRRDRLRSSEPRVRANIVETLWSDDREGARALLEVAIRDDDNRVAGNACLAFYNAGDTRSLTRLAEMIESPDLKEQDYGCMGDRSVP